MPIDEIVRNAVREIGYVNDDDVFHADKIVIQNIITRQSPDIAQGVDASKAEGKGHAEQGAGDQGLMFGFACDETPELMPAPIMFAHRLGRELTRIRKSGKAPLAAAGREVAGLGHLRGRQAGRHLERGHLDPARRGREAFRDSKFVIEEVIRKVLPNEMLTDATEYLINPTGSFVIGGPQGDTGLTGRKIIVDSYGGMGRHGGGAFSGKDPSKVDRSAAYMGRWVAKNVVASGSGEALRSPVRLRHRLSGSGEHEHQHLRHQLRSRGSNRARRQSQSSPSSRPTSSSSSTCSARSTPRPPTTAISARTIRRSPGNERTKPRS